jgi:hypothetical protein
MGGRPGPIGVTGSRSGRIFELQRSRPADQRLGGEGADAESCERFAHGPPSALPLRRPFGEAKCAGSGPLCGIRPSTLFTIPSRCM